MIIEDYTPSDDRTFQNGPMLRMAEGKFVHIIGPPNEYLLLSPVSLTKYHAHIVQRFSRCHDELSFVMTPGGDDGRFLTPGWDILGGGWFRLDRDAKILELWGASKAYGSFDGPALREKVRSAPDWEDFEVRMGGPE